MSDEFDLTLARHLDAAPDLVWRAWTDADLLRQWFTPAPVTVREAVIDPRPGGRFYTCMRLPDGTEIASEGCILSVEPERRLVFTDAMTEGWRPAPSPFMTAIITLAPDGQGTAYGARVLHADAPARDRHAEMGFERGWGAAADQLEAVARSLGA
ncbi:Uncharacterized conserved protein YndB, AHSA1/START domain [Tranquillimonas rosea]|uniref:Uncharacterized conserved protein YndB, AHSA1/START domain n=1 Tax=Tranquillimonas rosea TaxID=641238 RepID=A0A1H9S9H6_9RHOB|nr:SRPBCC family protein [Tranquillimonas rosea]SER80829.1 Uncharacterized conserved protein YndB, AHSA1/START domain [Tranquillimonas rosea]